MNRTLEYALFLTRHLDKSDFRSAVVAVLTTLGVSTGHAAFDYLTEAVVQYHLDPTQSFTKEIYPDVGARHTPRIRGALVERSIRYTISVAWEQGERELWLCFFPHRKTKCPTNGDVISGIARFLELWQRCYEAPGGEGERPDRRIRS